MNSLQIYFVKKYLTFVEEFIGFTAFRAFGKGRKKLC